MLENGAGGVLSRSILASLIDSRLLRSAKKLKCCAIMSISMLENGAGGCPTILSSLIDSRLVRSAK